MRYLEFAMRLASEITDRHVDNAYKYMVLIV